MLWSEKDEYGYLDDQRPLLDRWIAASNGKLSAKVVTGATHGVKEETSQRELCDLTVGWLTENFGE